MLLGNLSIRLILLMGESVPLPAPSDVIEAVQSVEVTNDAESGDGFQMSLSLVKDKKLDYGLLRNRALKPGNRVAIAVLMGAVPEVLIDGVITHQQVKTSGGSGGELTVTGMDVSSVLDLKEKDAIFENQPDSIIVSRIILSSAYAKYGLVPAITPTTDIPLVVDRVPHQQETDLAFIRRLAERNGFVFYIEPLTLGVNKAHWGPENRIGLPQPALTQDMGASTNVKSLGFSLDALEPVSTEGLFVEPFLKMTIPIPSLPSLRIPPLATSPAPAIRTVRVRDTANNNVATAATKALAAATNAPPAVTGEGELDTVRYGHVLRARRLVGVRGSGLSFDGLYTVMAVSHKLARGDYTQSFRISREGIGTTTPVVVT